MKLKMSRVASRGTTLNLYFSPELSFYPWREGDPEWFTDQVRKYWNLVAGGYKLGQIYTNRYTLPELLVPELGRDGEPASFKHAIEDPRKSAKPFVRRIGARSYPKGLNGRHIALWQSHGRYYNEADSNWIWQRATLFRTVEDMYTQSFVLPYLIPMLENAGAYTLTPRERDIQPMEYIADNDPSFPEERSGLLRRKGEYSENGSWTEIAEGFADHKAAYTFEDFPFSAGTARMAACSGDNASSTAKWTAGIETEGDYAVYVSYKTLSNSCPEAHYKISHAGGTTEFTVNQQISGGTWVYLGTFHFEGGSAATVELDNRGSEDCAVSADAVKIGGGVGKILRGGKTSGFASAYEGAHYWMHWAGVDTSITQSRDTDYYNDFVSRGAWTAMMKEQKEVPIDLSLAFHSDAGKMQNDSIVGTLAIYTLRVDGERELSDGRDRIVSRLYSDFVQTQIVDDLREDFDPDWTRRGTWDKSYSESRTTGVPALLLELLSHQNFADMKHGLDPAFRFTVSRAVYKGILKTLSAFYGCDYAVQPLPVTDFAARLLPEERVRLDWRPVVDTKEPTARSEGYIVYTRIDGGAWDEGIATSEPYWEGKIEKGKIYSYKIEAFNSGGKSFPSEILSVGLAAEEAGKVLIINNFDRISAPVWFDTPSWAGFDGKRDSGVPYIRDISYIGENYEFDRSAEYVDDNYSGFGSSYDDYAGKTLAGNTFDYPFVHGKSLMELGYSFFSMSRDAFCAQSAQEADVLDIICGKQAKTKIGRGAVPDRYPVWTEALLDAVKKFYSGGGKVFVSGSNIASDCDKRSAARLEKLLGYKLANPRAGVQGIVEGMEFSHSPNPEIYSVESADGLYPVAGGGIWLRYPRSNYGAAVYFSSGKHRSISMGVPLEVLKQESDRTKVLGAALRYLQGDQKSPKL